MKLSKFANLVKNGGRCAILHVAGSGIWLSTGTAIYRATELPDMEGSEQVRTVLDMTADAWKKVYLTEDWPESINNVLGLNLAPYAQGEQDTEKLKVAAAPNGLWCSACRCKVDGELIFYNEAYLAPLAEEIKKSEYIYYTARQTQTGQRYLVVQPGSVLCLMNRMRYCGTHAEEEPRRQRGDYCQYCGHRLREIGRERFCNNVNCRNQYVNV